MIFCDTSLLLSLYVADRWTGEATDLVEDAGQALVWTSWHELELCSALEARVGRGVTSRSEAKYVYQAIAMHQADGFLRSCSPRSWGSVFSLAGELARAHGAGFLNRGMDVLHVALCQSLKVETFWSMDDRQRKLAGKAGLEVNSLEM